MLEKQIWVYWHLHLQVVVSTIHAAFSGLFGLGTLTKGIFQCNNSKWSQRHQKIWKNDTIQPLAFDLAFTTFIGLLYFSRNPWCLRSPMVYKKWFSDHYFIHITFQTRFSNLDHCAALFAIFNEFLSITFVENTFEKQPSLLENKLSSSSWMGGLSRR